LKSRRQLAYFLVETERRPAMATTTFLYHALGLRDYRLLRTEYRAGAVEFHVELRPSRRRCRGCGAGPSELTLHGRFERRFITVPVGRRRQHVVLHGHEQLCRRCGKKLREPIPFARGKARHTRQFERLVNDLCQIATIQHVARLLGISWTLVKDLFTGHLRRKLRRRARLLRRVRYLAVDEFAIRKGHKYITVVLDLERGMIIHVGDGRSADALLPILRRLKRLNAPLQAIAMDMWPAYQLAVQQVFPDLPIIYDRYHVVAAANAAVDATRRDIIRRLSKQDRRVLKGFRYVLLRGGETLGPDALSRLERLQNINQPLYRAYLLKEDLRRLWIECTTASQARAFLHSWCCQAYASGIHHFRKLADSLLAHSHGILAYFDHRITTGPLEGLNNTIKTLKRQAYGYRDMEYFKLRLAFIHEATPAFPG